MRVVVTGASGFIGRNVLLRAPRDWDIIALYHRTADLEAFVARHALGHVRVMRCDLLDAADVQAVVKAVGERADAILYLAANGDPTVSAARPRWDLESNTTALVTFLETTVWRELSLLRPRLRPPFPMRSRSSPQNTTCVFSRNGVARWAATSTFVSLAPMGHMKPNERSQPAGSAGWLLVSASS
jgi:NAD(P)-dependent dehydrogenase (short-subunit alcohol dehydrogenase family)